MFKAFVCNNGFAVTRLVPLFRYFPFKFPLKFLSTTTTSVAHPFPVSYLINNFGLSPESALKASKKLHFETSQKPDSVLSFFRNHGFSDSFILTIIKREPWILSCDPNKQVLPKFQFLLSIGASESDIVRVFGGNPRIMKLSLKNRVIPSYKLVAPFLRSDKNALASIIAYPPLLYSENLAPNLKLMVDNGVGNPSIFRVLRTRPNVILSRELGKLVQELKNMGFDPSKTYFGDALLAKTCISKTKWNEKIDTFKSWGWSEETVFEAIRRQPKCIMISNEKINRVMHFWVNELGWDSFYLVKAPGIFAYSLEKRVIPRAYVVHFLLSKGLLSETASLLTPYFTSEKLFLERYVKCFKDEEASELLKLYHGKMNVEDKRPQGNLNMPGSKNI